MQHSTGGTTAVAIPHSPAEWAAMEKFYTHVGSKARPNCRKCVVKIDDTCAEGTELRRAVAHASNSRSSGIQR